MCLRIGCPFSGIRRPPDDGFIRILIIGATGMTGTAVLSAAIMCIWFKITVFTRHAAKDIVEEMLKRPIQKVVEGDMFEYESVLEAMEGIDAVFFSTTYWDTMRTDCEFTQGYNVVKAAKAAGVKHILYVGTPYTNLLAHEPCRYLQGKEKIESHIVASGLPYTILHLGFYYENLLSVFKPHQIDQELFALALPMGNVALNCGSVRDFGQCIAKMMLRPTYNIYKTIKLATGYHTVSEMANILDEHFQHMTFFDPKIPLSVYRGFDFKGSHDIATMFAYYQSIHEQWPQNVAHSYYNNCRTFKDWVIDEEQLLLEVLSESTEMPCNDLSALSNNQEQKSVSKLDLVSSPVQQLRFGLGLTDKQTPGKLSNQDKLKPESKFQKLLNPSNPLFRRVISVFSNHNSSGSTTRESNVDEYDMIHKDVSLPRVQVEQRTKATKPSASFTAPPRQ